MGHGRKGGRNHPSARAILAGVVAAACASAAATPTALMAQTPPPAGYQIKTLGLTGEGYEYVGSFGVIRSSNPGAPVGPPVGPLGNLPGSSNRYSSGGAYLGRDAWYFNGSSFQAIGVVGAGYEYTTGAATYRDSAPQGSDSTGRVLGSAERVNAAGGALGLDSWWFNGSSTQVISPSGGNYEYTDGGGTHRWAQPVWMDAVGGGGGFSRRYAANGEPLGEDVWRYNGSGIQVLGLGGAEYQYTLPGGTFQSSSGGSYGAFNPAGQVTGTTTRFASDGTSLGTDSWFFNGTSSQRINPIGGVYEYSNAGGIARDGYAHFLSDAGLVVGQSSRYGNQAGDDLGADAWLFNGTSTQVIGLFGGAYEYDVAGKPYRTSVAVQGGIGAGGHVIGKSLRYGSGGAELGNDSWVHRGGVTTQIGLVGAGYEYTVGGGGGGTFRMSEATFVNPAGRVVGASSRFGAAGEDLGRDVWEYDGATSRRINLAGAGYERNDAAGVYRDGSVYFQSATGTVAGSSARFSTATGADLGGDAWYYDGVSTRVLGLTGPGYEKSTPDGTYRYSSPQSITDNGLAIGWSYRYDAAGADKGWAGWFFDDATDLLTPLEFSIDANGESQTMPRLVTEQGVVLGMYRDYSASGGGWDHAFWWSPDGGFHDLGAMVSDGGLAAAGWDRLIDVGWAGGTAPGGSPQFVRGVGLTPGQYPEPFGPATPFLLIAQVPEPASAGLVTACASLLVLSRRRRRA